MHHVSFSIYIKFPTFFLRHKWTCNLSFGDVGWHTSWWLHQSTGDFVMLLYNVGNPCNLWLTLSEKSSRLQSKPMSKLTMTEMRTRMVTEAHGVFFITTYLQFGFKSCALPTRKTCGSNKRDPPQTPWSQALISELFSQSRAEETVVVSTYT